MATKNKKGDHVIPSDHGPAPRHHATLDYWYGPMQHTADGASTDPKMQEGCKVGKKSSSAKEPPQRSV
jgi:hypothetical protein